MQKVIFALLKKKKKKKEEVGRRILFISFEMERRSVSEVM
jgi:hypothetical protein